jgi:polysaccharide export outer membrane protein
MPINSIVRVAAFALIASAAFTQTSVPSATAPAAPPRATYELGPDDMIAIRVSDAEEVSDKAIRIGSTGYINLPWIGRLKAAGLTTEDLEKTLTEKLKPFIRRPEVSVNIIELRSQPVSIFGAVVTPGIHQLQGKRTLVEVLSLAGGPRSDAGYSVKITRQKQWGTIPLPNVVPDASGMFTVAEVNLKDIMDAKNPVENIFIMPNDVITVPRGEVIYVIGDVKKAGGFVLSDKAHISVLQALSMASGLERSAARSKAKILRVTPGSTKRVEVAVDLKSIMEGKGQDLSMEADDILFVPGSKSRNVGIRALEAALQMGTGIMVYRAGNGI